jgi:hypothetical protein
LVNFVSCGAFFHHRRLDHGTWVCRLASADLRLCLGSNTVLLFESISFLLDCAISW